MSTADTGNVTAPTVTPETIKPDVTASTVTAKAANGVTDPAKNEAEFLRRAVPWPKHGAPGYVNLHWTPGFSGKPLKTLDEFMRWLDWARRKLTIKDIYYCMSLQAEASKNRQGNLIAKRHSSLALSLKAIWLDIDVKEPPKGYNDLNEAMDALQAFRIAANLPPPSALVHSGGGLHVYWISDRALPKAEWEPYAQGLKASALMHGLRCDAAVTTDAARVLRVPNTSNHKTDPARPVKLLGLRPEAMDYDFPASLGHLPTISPVHTAPTSSLFLEGNQPTAPAASLAALPKESLSEGLNKYEDQPSLDFGPLVKECAFIREALKTGGKDYSQPMWNLTTLAATFMEHGEKLAHKMGNQHPGYTPESTDALWERKKRERQEKGLGWPSCNAIQAAGCAACTTCPHFPKGKSPLHLTTPIVIAAVTSECTLPPSPSGTKPKINGRWPSGVDDKTGRPRKGILNTIAALDHAGITCTWDDFRQKEYWFGHTDRSFDGEVRDAAVAVTRRNIEQKFHLYPMIAEARDAITCACQDNKTNPVLDYFNSLKWDGTPRLEKLLHKYLGADDTPLNDAISRKVMCAIVRRAKKPGCKFDHQIVLQGVQGIKKSMFCEDLAVFPDLYTDAGDLSGSIKDQMDIIQGKQIIEFPELAGYSRASREHNKAMLSRKVDRARLSYAHYATDAPRGSISVATTNEGQYLNDPTGERRYWHVAVKHYDRDAFHGDKDQIYAEAVKREPTENLWLDTPELMAAHDAMVATVKEPNELVDQLADLYGEAWHVNGEDEERISTADIRNMLNMTLADAVRTHNIGRRIADAMKTLGWTRARGTLRCHKGHQPTTGYTRPLPFGPRNKPKMPVSWV
jgi:hypothetical protein